MYLLRNYMAPALVAMIGISIVPAQAQNALQNWINKEENKLQQSSASGLINSSQAQRLQNREAKIQQQEQQYLQQNGGVLTNGEQHQISNELRGLNGSINKDVRKDNAGFYPNGYQNWQGRPGWGGFNNQFVNGISPGQPLVNPVTGQPMIINPQTGQPVPANAAFPYHHHHHDHEGFGNGRWNNGNGGWNGGTWNNGNGRWNH